MATQLRTSTSPAPAAPITSDQAEQIARALYRALFTAPPRRCALMKASGDHKYSDAPKKHQLSVADICDHLDGIRTWATTLAGPDGQALAGCCDYDQGGELVLLAALDAARTAGRIAFGIHMPGAGTDDDHDGGHYWELYNQPAPVRDITAQLATLPKGKGEIYPSGNCIRLPLGLHRRKNTRGTLILQDGRRFDLDQPDQRVAGLRAILALRRNATPPLAPESQRSSAGGTFGAAYDAAAWESITSNQGAALMASYRYSRLLFVHIPQLAQLARGERVTTYRDGAPDDSNSAQVAVLVANLITSHRKGRELGDGAPPEAEIRAVALHWKPTLRDGRSLAHYQAHIDSEIARYRPTTYRPEATAYTSARPADAPSALVESETKRGRGRPVGSQGATRLARLNQLATLLLIGAEVQRKDLARATQVSERQIGDDLKTLQASGRVKLRRIAHGYRVESSGDIFPSDVIGTYAPLEASQRDKFCIGETPARPCPPGAGAVAPPAVASALAASDAPALIASDPTAAPLPQASQGSTGGAGVSPCPASASTTSSDIRTLALPQPVPLRPQLAALVCDAFDAVAGSGKRVTRRLVRRYVRLQEGGDRFNDDAIDRQTTAERKRRSAQRRVATFDALRAKARGLSADALKRASKSAAGAYTKAEKKGDPRAAFYRIRAGILAEEETRRAGLDEGDAARWAAAEPALDKLRQSRTAILTVPRPVPVEPPAPDPLWRGVVERLKERAAALALAA
jgi:hypothetical protein